MEKVLRISRNYVVKEKKKIKKTDKRSHPKRLCIIHLTSLLYENIAMRRRNEKNDLLAWSREEGCVVDTDQKRECHSQTE